MPFVTDQFGENYNVWHSNIFCCLDCAETDTKALLVRMQTGKTLLKGDWQYQAKLQIQLALPSQF